MFGTIMHAETTDSKEAVTVLCPAGTFTGRHENGAIQFLGIRYAVSERFGPPAPYRYPEGAHDATSACPLGVQTSSFLVRLMMGVDVD